MNAGLLLLLMFFAFIGGYLQIKEQQSRAVVGNPIYQGSSGVKEIALTVNVAWGEEYIGKILNILAKEKVLATFFITGSWAEKFPELTKEISLAGHEIGNHSYGHLHSERLSKEENLVDLKKAEEILFRLTGKIPKLFAPPYGEKGPTVLQAADESNYQMILWSIDSLDWKNPEPKVLVERVTQKAHNGAIILMHPTFSTIKALPEIISILKKKGYQLVTVSVLLDKIKIED